MPSQAITDQTEIIADVPTISREQPSTLDEVTVSLFTLNQGRCKSQRSKQNTSRTSRNPK